MCVSDFFKEYKLFVVAVCVDVCIPMYFRWHAFLHSVSLCMSGTSLLG